jgi:hypothetical protein
MGGILFLFVLLIICLIYVLYLYYRDIPESFITRDIPVNSENLQPIGQMTEGHQQLNQKSALRSDDFGQGVTRPDRIAPSTSQGILSDYSISLSKPYDDFGSPEPHHLEGTWSDTLDRACNALSQTDCQSSQYCILVNGDTCKSAFPNTTDARMYNNYETKTLPQSDLSYYYRDGKCYGECSGWNPTYKTPDPIQLSNLVNNSSYTSSSAGILTTGNMYNKVNTSTSGSNVPEHPSTMWSEDWRSQRMPSTGTKSPNEYNPLNPIYNTTSDRKILYNQQYPLMDRCDNLETITLTPTMLPTPTPTISGLVCNPECAVNYHCTKNNMNQSVCMPDERLYGQRAFA